MVKIIGESSPVTLSRVSGDASIRTSYHDIKVEAVDGHLDIDGGSCAVTVHNVKKDARILSSYKPVTVDGVAGALDINSPSSDVYVKDIGSHTTILTSYKTVRAENIGGKLQVDGSSSSVLADRVVGDVDVVNSYKYVILKGTSGSIHVRGDSSPIEVSNLRHLPAGGAIELITTYKPVTLGLPATASVKISAQTEYGKIRSDFPVYLMGDDDKQVKIEVGTGGNLVRIATSGDITIRKE
jgi:DUF4097 and DUF4098 domain-containing protein YvlB